MTLSGRDVEFLTALSALIPLAAVGYFAGMQAITPRFGKVLLTFILFFAASWLFYLYLIVYDATLFGFPLSFYTRAHYRPGTVGAVSSLNLIALLGDIMFWYAISCIAVRVSPKRVIDVFKRITKSRDADAEK